MKKGALFMTVVIWIFVSLAGMMYAVEKPPAKGPLIKTGATVTTADIKLLKVELAQCTCKKVCDIMDAMAITSPIALIIRNTGPVQTTEVTIKVTVFNYISNSEMTYTEKRELKANPNGWQHYFQAMAATPSYPVVVKKSYGLKVEILPSTPGITDPKPSDNTMTVKSCSTYN